MNIGVVILLILAGSAHSTPLPKHEAIEHAVAESRRCQDRDGTTDCLPLTAVTVGERCWRIPVPRRDAHPYNVAHAAARCSFRWGERFVSIGAALPRRWKRAEADFYYVGTPCGEEGQESDLICMSWMVDGEVG